jgi:hypothetical protein
VSKFDWQVDPYCQILMDTKQNQFVDGGWSSLRSSRRTKKCRQSKRVVIAASTVLDGKDGVLHNPRIVVEGARIAAIDPNVGHWTMIWPV